MSKQERRRETENESRLRFLTASGAVVAAPAVLGPGQTKEPYDAESGMVGAPCAMHRPARFDEEGRQPTEVGYSAQVLRLPTPSVSMLRRKAML